MREGSKTPSLVIDARITFQARSGAKINNINRRNRLMNGVDGRKRSRLMNKVDTVKDGDTTRRVLDLPLTHITSHLTPSFQGCVTRTIPAARETAQTKRAAND